jgi:hypothetical protein
MESPTLALYKALQVSFDHFNAELFEGKLPPCLITLRSASRVYGYHHAGRFIAPNGQVIDELGMHPGFFTLRPIEAVMSTLVHEMVHHWQHFDGTPSASNAHNRQWAEKMISLGLSPSSTGLPGGKKTGRSVSHYIIPDGVFVRACRKLLATGFALPWLDRHAPSIPESQELMQAALKDAGIVLEMSPAPYEKLPPQTKGAPTVWNPAPKKPATRFRYACPMCQANAWAARDAKIVCGVCNQPMGHAVVTTIEPAPDSTSPQFQ